MYRATVKFTVFGLGDDVRLVMAKSYKELNEKVDNLVEYINNKKTEMLETVITSKVNTVVYNYPSGKSFTKRF